MALFWLQGKGGSLGNCIGPLLSCVLTILKGRDDGTFLGMGLNARFGLDHLVELGCKTLYTDSLVGRAASFNLEKEEKIGSPRRYSTLLIYHGTNVNEYSFFHQISAVRTLLWNLFTYVSSSSPRCWRIQASLVRKNLASA